MQQGCRWSASAGRQGPSEGPGVLASEKARRSNALGAVLSWHRTAASAAPQCWEPRCPVLEVGQSFQAGKSLFKGACSYACDGRTHADGQWGPGFKVPPTQLQSQCTRVSTDMLRAESFGACTAQYPSMRLHQLCSHASYQVTSRDSSMSREVPARKAP